MGWPFALVTAVGVILLFQRRSRSTGLGFTIVCAAAWVTVLGPRISDYNLFSRREPCRVA